MERVILNHYTPLVICSNAIRTCWQSQDKSDNGGEKDQELIERVGNKFKHSSTLEHLVYNFKITCSRAVLQEWSRHRIASLSVKSTRYTLKELKDERPFVRYSLDIDKGIIRHFENIEVAKKYLVFTNDEDVDNSSMVALEELRQNQVKGKSNDIAKYSLPEAYKTEINWTINGRSLQNFLALRTSKSALWEIREIAFEVLSILPEDHKYLFK